MQRYTAIITTGLIALTLTAFSAEFYKMIQNNERPVAANSLDSATFPITKGLTHFPYIYEPFDDFYINVDSRFMATISKQKLQSAVSVIDLVPAEADWASHPIQIVKVTAYHDSTETSMIGASAMLNPAQIQLLSTVDYADNFSITASCVSKNTQTGIMEHYELVYYISVTPETEAVYYLGKDALTQYLKENSRQAVYIATKDKLQAGTILFTVTREGTVAGVTLTSTSGFPTIDEKMISLTSTIPGLWEPALNAKGEKIDQQFVLFFGTMGC